MSVFAKNYVLYLFRLMQELKEVLTSKIMLTTFLKKQAVQLYRGLLREQERLLLITTKLTLQRKCVMRLSIIRKAMTGFLTS